MNDHFINTRSDEEIARKLQKSSQVPKQNFIDDEELARQLAQGDMKYNPNEDEELAKKLQDEFYNN